jgi:hypothetical protein
LHKKIQFFLFWSIPVGSTLVLWWCLHAGISNWHYDGVAHLNIARRVFDHPQPQLKLIGTVWLPLQHLLLLPLVQSDALWATGLAGSLISILSFWAAAFFLYQLGCRLFRDVKLAWLGVGFFVLNPNILYLQSTALGEMLYIALILGFYYYLSCLSDSFRWQSIWPAALLVALATLTRYDAWPLAIAGGLWAVWVGRCRKIRLKRLLGGLAVYGVLASAGIIIWLFFNGWILGDPLAFAKGEYATSARIGRILAEAGLNQYPPLHHLLASGDYYWEAVRFSTGLILLVMGILGFLFVGFLQFHNIDWPVWCVLFLYPPAFYIYNMYRGTGIIYVPTLPPHGILNIRYTALFIPALCLMAPACLLLLRRMGTKLSRKSDHLNAGFRNTLLVRLQKILPVLLLSVLLLQYAEMFLQGRDGMAFLQEAYVNGRGRKMAEYQVAGYLKRHYDGKPLLMDVSEHGIIPPQSGIPLVRFINESVYGRWEEALAQPSSHVEWVVVQKKENIWKRLGASKDLKDRFKLVFQAETPVEPTIFVFRKINP